jgi:hypothetical protein
MLNMSMPSLSNKYTLDQVNAILFAGFDYTIPEESINILNYLTTQIGSNAFITSNVYKKKEKIVVNDVGDQGFKMDKRKKKGNKSMEVFTEDWDTIRSFQATKFEQKSGIYALIDKLKLSMSKLTKDKYLLIKEQIMEVLYEIIELEPDTDILRETVGNTMFDIVLSNKTLLRLYAELYTDLIGNYAWLRQSIDNYFIKYIDLFKDMRYFDPDTDYDKFCDMNVVNEKRKLTSHLFVYLALNGCLSKPSLYEYLVVLLKMMSEYIHQPNKKFEVDEITENIAILFNKDIIRSVEDSDDYDEDLYIIDGLSIMELITVFAKSKAKDYKSLSNKAIFKCMDLVEM